MSEAHKFLSALFAGAPNHAAIQLWHKASKKTHYYAVGLIDRAVTHVEQTQDSDLYVAAGLGPKVQKANRARVPATAIAAIPGVWADIDINGGPEGKSGAAATREQALALASSLLDPSIIVNSGYGIQAWWLFEDGPWAFTNAEREQAARMVQGFQQALKANAKEHGFTIDSTFDLARLMRVPGTLNFKGTETGYDPAPVTLEQLTPDRYTLEDFRAVSQNHLDVANQSIRRVTGEGIEIVLPGGTPDPSFRVGQLLGMDVDFKLVWERKKLGRTAGWSDSQFDLSIATRLAEAGAGDQEMADALVASRALVGDPKGKSQRLDYLSATIGKAKLRSDLADQEEENERSRSDAEEQLEAIATTGATSEPARTVSLFTQLLGGPEIKELIQDSRDPEQARFRLVLDDGREIPIGSGADLLNPDKFRSAFAVVTRFVVPAVKRDKWHKVIQALLHAATVNEDSEDTRASRGTGFVRDFIERGLSNDRDAACQAHDPFMFEGEVYIPLGPLAHWMRRVRSERMADADLKQLLIAAGLERRTVNYVRDDEKKSSRSYWVGTDDQLDNVGEDD